MLTPEIFSNASSDRSYVQIMLCKDVFYHSLLLRRKISLRKMSKNVH